jgi:4-cresol dehydrogenase (hydroxylating)
MKEYEKNIYSVRKEIEEVYFPESSDEVQSIVRMANDKEISVYPISTGKNYGLGSHLPVIDHSIVIDLSKMNRILSYDDKLGTITIEAGVTQQQVYQFLKDQHSNFFLNVTGSTKSSSLIGNALDRGIAHFGMRAHEIISLKGVLGNGEKFTTGSNTMATSKSKDSYRYGLGPDLTDLFFQSNFGIITSAIYKLIPRPEEISQISIEKSKESLANFVERLMDLRRKNLIPANLHISNLNRRKSISVAVKSKEQKIGFAKALEMVNQEAAPDYLAVTSLCGSKRILELNFEILKEKFIHGTKITYSQVKDTCSNGVPSDDAILSLGYGQQDIFDSDLANSFSGTLFNVLVIPAIGKHVELAIAALEQVYSRYGFLAFITLNLIEDTSFEAVVNLTFDRRNENEIAAAHDCHIETMIRLNQLGYPPLRMSIFQMKHFRGLQEDHLSNLKKIKNIFDPSQILSEGRYL